MSTAFAGSMQAWDYLLDTWRELQVPEGWRAELTAEGIQMTPPPGGPHNADGPVPQYLLIDRFNEDGPAVSLFTEPVRGVYSRTVRVPFGEPVEIGAPFGVRLETSEF
jgi:hypothetical protein